MYQAWFVSDLHLTSISDKKAGKFLAFLNSLTASTGTTHLFLLGDIFDLWIADHGYFIEQYQPIINELHRIMSEGIEVHYFEGNHDLYLKRFWADALGVNVHEGPQYFELGGRCIRVEHGDESNPEDRGYLFLRWFLRTPVMKWLAHRLPESVVVWIGRRSSEKSRTYTSHVKSIDEDVAKAKLHEHARRTYLHKPFSLLINGHVHVRDDFEWDQNGKRIRAINLGTWLKQPVALKVTTDSIVWTEIN